MRKQFRASISAGADHAGQQQSFYLEGSAAATNLEEQPGTVWYLRMDRERMPGVYTCNLPPPEVVSRLRDRR
jgi:hypothetical protein